MEKEVIIMPGPGGRGGPGGHRGGGPMGGPGGHHRGGPMGGPRGHHHMPPPPPHHRGYYRRGGCLGCCMPVIGSIALIASLVGMLVFFIF